MLWCATCASWPKPTPRTPRGLGQGVEGFGGGGLTLALTRLAAPLVAAA